MMICVFKEKGRCCRDREGRNQQLRGARDEGSRQLRTPRSSEWQEEGDSSGGRDRVQPERTQIQKHLASGVGVSSERNGPSQKHYTWVVRFHFRCV